MKTTLMIVVTLFAIGFPLTLVIYWKKRTKVPFSTFLIGALGFTLFAYIIEPMAHSYFLSINKTTSTFINNNPIVFVLYAALMAGLFEETGRLFMYKIFSNKYKNKKETAIAYGIGHGGIECVLMLGLTYLIYVIVTFGFSLGDPSTDALILQTIEGIQSKYIIVAAFERISALMLHLSLSILVYKSVFVKKRFYLYPLSILLHTLADIPASLYQTGIITSIEVIETLTFIISIAIFLFAIKTYTNMEVKEDVGI